MYLLIAWQVGVLIFIHLAGGSICIHSHCRWEYLYLFALPVGVLVFTRMAGGSACIYSLADESTCIYSQVFIHRVGGVLVFTRMACESIHMYLFALPLGVLVIVFIRMAGGSICVY